MENLQQVDGCHASHLAHAVSRGRFHREHKPGPIEQNEYLLGKNVRALCNRTGDELYRGTVTGLKLSAPRNPVPGLCGYCGVFAEIKVAEFRHHLSRVEFVEIVGSELREPIECNSGNGGGGRLWVNEMGADSE